MNITTSVTLIFRVCGIRLLSFSLTLVVALVDLFDRSSLGSLNSFFGDLRRVFGLNSDLERTAKVQLCVFDLEKSL